MDRDDGFTLVELLVAVVILVVITPALGAAVVVALRTTGGASDRLATAQDAQLASSAFAADISSADEVMSGPSSPSCGPLTPAPLLSLTWTDGTSLRRVSYALVPLGSTTALRRSACTDTAPAEERLLSRSLSAVGAPRCDGGSCTGTAAVPQTPAPRTVAWDFVDTDGRPFSLRGTRRVT